MQIILIYILWLIASLYLFYYEYINENKLLTPLNIFTLIWLICVGLYISRIILVDSLEITTLCIIIATHITVIIGYYCGKFFSRITMDFRKLKKRTYNDQKKLLYWVILITSIIASISIAPSFLNTIIRGGLNVQQNYNEAVQLSINQESAFSLSSLLFVAITFAGFYLNKYGFNKIVLFPPILLVMVQLTNGSRGTLVSGIVLFFSSYLISFNKKNIFLKIDKKDKKRFKLILFCMIFIVGYITISRASTTSMAASNLLKVLPFAGFIESIVFYLISGIGCLNKLLYLPRPDIMYFFRVPTILTNKLGLTNIDTTHLSLTYYFPMPSNVNSFIGDLFIDFGISFLIVVFILALAYGFFYYKAKKENSITYTNLFSCFLVIFVMSFFVYWGTMSLIWYVLVFGTVLSFFIEYKISSVRNR